MLFDRNRITFSSIKNFYRFHCFLIMFSLALGVRLILFLILTLASYRMMKNSVCYVTI